MAISEELMKKWIPRSTQIAMVEMIATVVALETFAHLIQGKKVIFLVDSESVLGALVKGYSSREDLCGLTEIFWFQVSDLEVLMYLDRISTDANIADDPSRDDMSVAEALKWVIAKPVLPRDL